MQHSKEFYSIRRMLEKILWAELNPVENEQGHVYQGYVLINKVQDPKVFVQLEEMSKEKKAIFKIVRFQDGHYKPECGDKYNQVQKAHGRHGYIEKAVIDFGSDNKAVLHELNKMFNVVILSFSSSISILSELSVFTGRLQYFTSTEQL